MPRVPAFASCLLLASCAARGPEAGGSPGLVQRSHVASLCEAMEVPGTTVVYESLVAGAAIRFTTAGDVEELRRRVFHSAVMHGRTPDTTLHPHDAGPSGAGDTSSPTSPRHPRAAGPTGPGGDDAGASPPGHRAHHGPVGAGQPGTPDLPPLVASQARAERLPDGVRLIFVPVWPEDVERLRDHVAQHADLLSRGVCRAWRLP